MKWIVFIVLMCIWTIGWSQNATELKRRAKEFFAAGRYEDALTTITGSRELSRTDEEGRFLLALCHYQLNHINESLDILKALTENEKAPFPECWFYLGRIYHARHQFLDAALNYKMYLKNASTTESTRRVVADMIRRCSNGQQFQYQAPKAFVENLGPQVNTQYDEFAPVLSPNNADRLYFSSSREGNAGGKRTPQGNPDAQNGKYFSDLFFCSNIKGVWSNVQPMPYQLNSPRHEVLLDFNKDGTALIYLKGLDLKKGEIIVDTFRQLEQRLVSSDPLLAPVRPFEGDEFPCFYNDTLILFASNRPGGYGGLDIYQTAYRNGRWTAPENMGTDVNTPYNETTPFLSRDGKTLYFSSDYTERSIGGLDIFKTTYIPALNRWTEPKTLGLPINSAGDDDHFRLALDGFTGFFSSDRKDGFGQHDLYIAYFNEYLSEQEEPEAAKIAAVERPKQTTPQTPPPTFTEEKFPEPIPPAKNTAVATNNTLYFNTSNELFTTNNQRLLDEAGIEIADIPDRKLVITVYAMKSPTLSAGLSNAISNAEAAAKYLVEKGVAPEAIFLRGAVPDGNEGNSKNNYAMLLETVSQDDFVGKGEMKVGLDPMLHQGLHYKIQIGSAKGEYKSDLLRQFSHPMVEKTLDFEYYRYTVGAVKTFSEAQRLRQQLIAKGISGAFVAPYIKGVRADRATARQYVAAFPDLANFLK